MSQSLAILVGSSSGGGGALFRRWQFSRCENSARNAGGTRVARAFRSVAPLHAARAFATRNPLPLGAVSPRLGGSAVNIKGSEFKFPIAE